MQIWEWCLLHKIQAIIITVSVVIVVIFLIFLINYFVNKKKGKRLFVFRRYKKYEGPPNNKQQHPKLIVEETDEEYGFMGLTESPKHGKTKNLPIKNPQKGNDRKSYIRKEVRHAKKDDFFDEILKEYELTEEDKEAIIRYLENKKKK